MIDTPFRPAASSTRIDALQHSQSLFDAGAHVEGGQWARTALAGAVAAADPDGQRAAWDLIALHADRLGHMAVATSAAEEALALLPVDAVAARSLLHCRLARSFAVLELDAPNLRHATAALACARTCGEPELIALSLARLGAARAASSDWAQAVGLIEEGLAIVREEGNGLETCRALNNLAAVSYYAALDASRCGDAVAAATAGREGLRWADEALLHPATFDDPYLALITRVNRDLLLLHAGRAAEALADSAEASDIAQRHGYREIAVQLGYARGKAIALLGDPAGGIALLEAALETTAVDEPIIRTRLHEELYLLHKHGGAFASALTHHEALLALERARSARRAEAEYGVLRERAEVQRTRLSAERAQRHAEMERLRATRMEGERDLMEARAAELGRCAHEDALTGMPNRRRIEAAMRTLLAEAGGSQGTIGIGVVDIDHFKRVNDTFGHGVGDDVIRTVGMLLTKGLRDIDLVGRFGGEEFVLLLSHTSSDAAIKTAERLRRAIEQHDWSLLRPGLAVTVSIGLSFTDRPCAPGEPMEQADAALYTAKAAGRNRAIVQPLVL
jgi:diguanylate cyclase (GGDEF)-like protein